MRLSFAAIGRKTSEIRAKCLYHLHLCIARRLLKPRRLEVKRLKSTGVYQKKFLRSLPQSISINFGLLTLPHRGLF